MLQHRVIPVLLLSDRGVVKTRKFKNPKYIGDALNTIRIFNEKEVDELIVLDITASSAKHGPDYDYIEKLASECFMPLTYGGGISSVEEAEKVFSLGIEKVSVQSAAVENLSILRQLVSKFGSQSFVFSIDIKKNWRGQYQPYSYGTGSTTADNWQKLVVEAEAAGVGEILINSVDKDGTLEGPDLTLIRQASKLVSVPLTALGGVSSLQDIKNIINADADAVAAGSFFVYHGPHKAVLITYPKHHQLKQLFEQY